MKTRPTVDTAYLVGGALLGAAAMYFMDPNVGARRRKQLAAAAEGAYDHARDAMGDHLQHVSGHVKNLAERVAAQVGSMHDQSASETRALAAEANAIAADLSNKATAHLRDKQAAASDYGHQAADIGHRIWDSARGLGAKLSHLGDSLSGHAHDVQDDLTGRAKDWRKWMSKSAADAQSRARSMMGREEHSGLGATAVVSTAVGFCAVGAGVMYFMDPARGRERRERTWTKGSELVCSAGQLMRATGVDIKNRLQGMTGQVMSRKIDSRQLIDDIRSQVGGWISNPHDVQFMADADGSVTATGTIAKEYLEKLLTHLHDVPGVNHVINRLTIREPSVARTPDSNPASASI